MSPGPFCCYTAIPSTLRHLSRLLPASTTHDPLQKPQTSAPLLASFLIHLITSQLPVSADILKSHSGTYFVIIQVKKLDGPPLTPASSSGVARQLSDARSIDSSRSIISMPPPSRPASTSPSEDESYFVPLEKIESPTSLDANTKVVGLGYREINRFDAMDSLRLPGSNIMIGDGEDWRLLEGVEKLWCETHRVWFELRVWISET